MLRNYFKIAYRNLFRNKSYSFINIIGLTLGITGASLLFMLVLDEFSFDSFHSKKDQIYRIIELDHEENDTNYNASTAPPVGATLVEDFSEVVEATRLFRFGGHINFAHNDDKYQERDYYAVDSNFFSVFDFELIHGDPATALSKPNCLVIDEDWAKALFGDENPVGKILTLSFAPVPSVITGVMKNVPDNSHIQVRVLQSLFTDYDPLNEYLSDWSDFGASTYIVLNENADKEVLQGQMPQFIDKYFGEYSKREFEFQAMNDIHFHSEHIDFGADDNKGRLEYMYVLIAIGIFMIAIASINYMNLATARSMHRGREIGLRKVSGARRPQLIGQFLGESTLTALIAFTLSVGLFDLVLPSFNTLTGKAFEFNGSTVWTVFGVLFGVTVLVGLLSGSYPALLLSKLQPARVLKGEMNAGKGSLTLRRILVIAQFSMAIIMIISTIVVFRQMNFVGNQSLGFDNNQMLIVDINNANVRNRFDAFKNELVKSPYIDKVAVSSRVPGEWKSIREVFMRDVESASTDSVEAYYMNFDEDMLDTYDMELLAGKNFTGNLNSDSLTILVNEKAVKSLSLADPVGTSLYLSNGRRMGNYRIVGVVKDYNFQSLHEEIAPIIMGARSSVFHGIDYFSIKIDGSHAQEAIAHATEVHNMFDESTPVEYHFLDEQWAQFYELDQRTGDIFMIGGLITIFIACMGLFGLASFIIEKRTKEIGVRKVLGASLSQLFLMLSKTFIVQVAVAFLIAAPISWYLMSSWLNTFAFRFDLGIYEFALAGVIVLIVAILSVSYRVVRAAHLNPTHALRSE